MLDLLKHWRMVLTFALLYLSQGICFGIAMDALNDDLSVRSRQARLWPQTEWLKAALILAARAEEIARLERGA